MSNAPRKRLRSQFYPFRQFCSLVPQSLYIDGVYARIHIHAVFEEMRVIIDGMGGESWTTLGINDATDHPIVIDFPPMRDEQGRLIRYDQRLRISCTNVNEGQLPHGFVQIVYEVDELPGSTL